MKPYRFRLATLLKIRESTRDERRRHLLEAQQAHDTLQARLGEIDDQLREARRLASDSLSGGPVNVDRLLDDGRYELVMLAEQAMIRQQSKTVAEEVERRRQTLVAADREVRVLEKLRETQQERHNVEASRREQQVIDEAATLGYVPREGSL
ncbi:MAG: flagellar export protein FliJ [Pirellulales bacterium]